MQKNPVVWWELASHDADKTVEFLRKVFDWEVIFDERLGFYTLPDETSPEGIGGGVFTLRKARLPFLALYIQVEDIDAKVRLIEQHGGYIVDPPSVAPGGSRICLFNEPSGVTLAMIQPAHKG